VGFFALVAIIGPFLVGAPNAFSQAEWQAPSGAHWLGTTQLGQDVLAQVVTGAGATLEIGAGAGLLATVISIVIGIGGGYAGGLADEALSLLSNVVLVIPALPLIIVIASFVHASGIWSTVAVIAFVSWAASARVLRAQTLSVRNREYVLAARAGGEPGWRIAVFEILPNELPIIVSQFIFSMIFAILTQAGLAFLGLATRTSSPGARSCTTRRTTARCPAGRGGGSCRPACASRCSAWAWPWSTSAWMSSSTPGCASTSPASDPVGLLGHAARWSSRRARWVVLLRSRGLPVQ
jgi:ABC-type antimicrobial peptide transport system permease subunit